MDDRPHDHARWPGWLLVALVGGCVWAAVGGALSAGFVYEGHPADLTEWLPTWRWTPRVVSYWTLKWQWDAGHGVRAYHGVSLGLHLVVGTLVWALARRLSLSPTAAILAAGVFLVHPLTVETAVYTAHRSEQFAAIGVLVACLCATGPWWAWSGIPVALGVGILGKESAIVGLGLVPLMWVVRRPAWWTRTLAILGSLAFLPLGAWWSGGLSAMVYANATPDRMMPWWNWALLQATAACRLLTLAVVPYWHWFTVDYDYDRITLAGRLLALLVLLSVGTVVWRAVRQHVLLACAGAWTVISLVPRFVMQTPGSTLNDHQMYLPLIGVVLGGMAWWDGSVARSGTRVWT